MDAKQALQQAVLYTDDIVYTMVRVSRSAASRAITVFAEHATPFMSCMIDKDEISLVMPLSTWEQTQNRLSNAKQEGAFRLITFDIALDFSLVGFMALVAQRLADAQVSLMALSAFSRDHIFVPADQFALAWTVLQQAE